MDKEKKYNLVYFEIVGFCNARCPWCVTGNKSLNQVSYPSRFINVNDFRNAIVTLLEGGLIYPRESLISLANWGEPMLHPELSEILKILRKNDVNFAISTNASKFVNLENDVLGNLQEIRFSVPGFSQSSYDRIHGFNLESILKNIEMFCKNIRKEGSNAKLMMAYHLYQFNIDEIDAAMKFCSLNGIEFYPYVAYLNDFNLAKAYLDKSISAELLRWIGKDLFLHYVDELIAKTPQDYQCPQFNILTIDEYCNVLTCCALSKDHPEYSLGNLFTLSSDNIRKGKLSQKVCIECVKLGISSWVHNPWRPGFINIEAQRSSLETSLQEMVVQIQQIQHSIPMQLVNRYQRVVEKLLCSGTRRRYYELGLTGIRVILNEGWKSFFRKLKARLLGKRDKESKQP
jgi:organic radical activating enzyme